MSGIRLFGLGLRVPFWLMGSGCLRVEVEAFKGACAGLVFDAQPRTGARMDVYGENGEGFVVSLASMRYLRMIYALRCDVMRLILFTNRE